MKLPELSPEDRKKFENGVIQVNGTAMNRTALGIIDAYFQLYPNTTFSELKEAFPDSLNPSGPRAPKSIFKPYSERDFGVVHSLEEIKTEFEKAGLPYEGLFFLQDNEMFKTSDGVTVIVNRLWESKDTSTGESDLQSLAAQALKFGIVINKFEARKPFGKGSYSLDLLEPEIQAKLAAPQTITVEKEVKKIPKWVWILIALLLLIPLILWLLGAFKSKTVVIEKEVVKTVVQVDTVYVKEIQNIEAKFNTVQYSVGSAVLPEDAKFALYDLAKVMEKQKDIKLKIEGHTSDEGSVAFNQKLSENRAKSVVDFLVSRGIDSTRLTFEGLGSSMPIDKANREKNRRTEFILLDKKKN